MKNERPYLWTSDVRFEGFSPEVPVGVDFLLGNYGKSPAVKERSVGDVFIGYDAKDQSDKWFRGLEGKVNTSLSSKNGGSLAIIPPGAPSDFNVIADKVLFRSAQKSDESTIQKIKITPKFVFAVAHFQYEDTTGNVYVTDACYFNFPEVVPGFIPTGTRWSKCEEHNGLK